MIHLPSDRWRLAFLLTWALIGAVALGWLWSWVLVPAAVTP